VPDFKFKVGELLKTNYAKSFNEIRNGKKRIATMFLVMPIERIFQECPAGVQVWYHCRPMTISPQTGLFHPHLELIKFNEIELDEATQEDIDAVLSEYDRLKDFQKAGVDIDRAILELRLEDQRKKNA